jgi:hypothetical protein
MSSKQTNIPGPDNASGPFKPDGIVHESEKERLRILKKKLPGLLREYNNKTKGRADKFYPFIMIRSELGDRGTRPISSGIFWESPDIWISPGDPSTSPVLPETHGGELTAGEPHTIYAHVWNLGRAPVTGVKVEFFWFDPSLSFTDDNAHYIGAARVELGPRSSPECHKLVKCPKAWVPQIPDIGHECIVARASAIGDYINEIHRWDAWADRHVAQRNIHVALNGAMVDLLMSSLCLTTKKGTRTQLLQVGTGSELTLKVAAPGLKADPEVQTMVLAELRSNGSLFLPTLETVGPMSQTGKKSSVPPAGNLPGPARIVPDAILKINPPALPKNFKPQPVRSELMKSRAKINHLFAHATLIPANLFEKMEKLKPPKAGEAQVLRFISLKGDQVIGGYTIVVHG